MDKKQFYITSLRSYRKLHRVLGISIALLLLISAVTGVLLSWKKNIDWIQPISQKGESKDLTTWKPMHELAAISELALLEYDSTQTDNKINRIDARPSKGIVKVIFEEGNWEVQIDATSGKVKSIAKRHSDWIESLHDGSIINDIFKLIAMNFLGIGTVFLALTGFWLWYGPRLIRATKRKEESKN